MVLQTFNSQQSVVNLLSQIHSFWQAPGHLLTPLNSLVNFINIREGSVMLCCFKTCQPGWDGAQNSSIQQTEIL